MMVGAAGPFGRAGTDTWCADWSGKARVVGAPQYCWESSLLWMIAWRMVIISWCWRTITACPILICSGNVVHFSTGCFFLYQKLSTHNVSFRFHWWNVLNLFGTFQFTWQFARNTHRLLSLFKATVSCCLSFFTLSPSIPLSHALPIIPLRPLYTLAHLFAQPFIFISAATTYQLAISRVTVITCAHVLCIQLSQPL